MEITQQYAQNIVNMTMKVLHYNINIMNHMGIIVGSGDPNRINSFHQGAAEVIETGKALEIKADQAGQLTGAKPGLNLPIYFHEKILGVVGITGEPDQVRPFGELLKISVETMLQEVFLIEQLRMEQNAKEFYIRDIVSGNIGEDEDAFYTKGSLLGFDMKIPRVAVVIKIRNQNEPTPEQQMSKSLKAGKICPLSLKIQRQIENIFQLIQSIFNNPQNIISYHGSNYFIIFWPTRKTIPGEIKAEVSVPLERLQTGLEKYNVACYAGIGLLHPGIAGLKKSYAQAVQAIDIRERTGNPQENIILASELGLEMIFLQQTNNTLQSYCDLFFIKNDHRERDTLSSQTKVIQTLHCFFDCNLNQSITAQKLNIARNTLTARLDKVMELTGYDPRSFGDAVKLRIFLLINELQK